MNTSPCITNVWTNVHDITL